jgi:hypothetical protein
MNFALVVAPKELPGSGFQESEPETSGESSLGCNGTVPWHFMKGKRNFSDLDHMSARKRSREQCIDRGEVVYCVSHLFHWTWSRPNFLVSMQLSQQSHTRSYLYWLCRGAAWILLELQIWTTTTSTLKSCGFGSHLPTFGSGDEFRSQPWESCGFHLYSMRAALTFLLFTLFGPHVILLFDTYDLNAKWITSSDITWACIEDSTVHGMSKCFIELSLEPFWIYS